MAQRRALAEELLTKARDLEAHLATERELIVTRTAAAAAAATAEREAVDAVRRARESLQSIRTAASEVATAEQRLVLARQTLAAALGKPGTQPTSRDAEAALATANAEATEAEQLVEQRRQTRLRAEAGVAEMQAQSDLLAGTKGLSVDAVKRVVARRVADALRQTMPAELT